MEAEDRQYRYMKRQNYNLLLILLASLLLSLLYMPPYNPVSGDKEVYHYVGRVILKGGVPYRDVFDHKPPLIYFLNAFELLLGNWGLWMIDSLFALLVTYTFFQLCRRYRLPFPWLLPLLFNLMLRDYLICLGMGMTREYTTMLLLLFFCLLQGGGRYRFFWLGLIAGVTFFIQQDQVFPLLPFFGYAFWEENDRSGLPARLAQTAGGFLSVTLPVVLYFAAHRAIGDLWRDAFRFNFTWYTTTLKESFGDHLRKLKLVLDQGNYEVPFMVAMTLGLFALFTRNSNKRLLLAALAAAALSIIPEFIGGRDIVPAITHMTFTHYFLPLSASLPILLFCVFAFTGEPALQGWKTQGIYGILICTSLFYTNLRHAAHLDPIKEDETVSSWETNYILNQKPGDYQLYVMGSTDYIYIYNELGIIGPSRWVYQHFWRLYENWDSDHVLLSSILQDLTRHHTTYIFDMTTADWFRDPAAWSLWQTFLKEHYEKVPSPGAQDRKIWKWKSTPDGRPNPTAGRIK